MSISLPKETQARIKKKVKQGKYASASEYIRALLRDDEEKDILAELRESEREIRAGKGKVLRSLADLD